MTSFVSIPSACDNDHKESFSCNRYSFLQHALKSVFRLNPPTTPESWAAKSASGLLLFVLYWGLFLLIPSAALTTAMTLVFCLLAQITLGIPFYRTLAAKVRTHSELLPLALAIAAATVGGITAFVLDQNGNATIATTLLHLPITLLPLGVFLLSEYATATDFDGVTPPLESLRVAQAMRVLADREESVSTETLKSGDLILIRAGERIPRDGTVVKGTTSVDESEITGDFRPLLKEGGKTVVGGSINRDGDIVVAVSQNQTDDVLERLIALAKKTETNAPDSVAGMAKFAKAAPVISVFIAAACFSFFWNSGTAVFTALATAIAVLCAMPAVIGSTGRIAYERLLDAAGERGIAFANSGAVATLAEVGAIFFNKTGTLSRGDFTFSQGYIEPGTNQGDLFGALFSLERDLDHPLARAMATHPWFIEIPRHPVNDAQFHAGLGVSGTVEPRGEHPYLAAAGNLRFVKRMRFFVSREMRAKMDDLEEIGETVILCGYKRQVRGILSFSDTLRPGVRSTLRRIQKLGVEAAMLTGDTEKTVTHLTGTLGIKKIYSRCTPEEKASKITRERESGLKVAVVDCDLHNNPALDAANVSLSLDTGAMIPAHPVDILILGPDFSLIHWLLAATRRFRKIASFAVPSIAVFGSVLTAACFLLPVSPSCIGAISMSVAIAMTHLAGREP